MKSSVKRNLIPIAIAVAATIPGVFLRVSGIGGDLLTANNGQLSYLVAIAAGISVLGASFLLLWACDAIQEDISQTLALAIVALIAVLPEYAVDMYITWTAGYKTEYAHYAIANMTGANRLIIGAAWLVIVAIYWFKTRQSVRIEKDRRTELIFLGMATLYAFVITLKGSLAWYDGFVFVGIYAWYIRVAGRRPCAECEADGPAELLLSMPKVPRRLATLAMFLVAAAAIGFNAEQFTQGLLITGGILHIPKATLIQWLAPIASEAPEFTVAIMFTLRRRAGLALGSLLSSNLNQWTLLVGMIPWAYAISYGIHNPGQNPFHHPIPMDQAQMNEIMLTAAQSLLGIIMLSTLRLSIGQVLLIFGLFAGQLIVPQFVAVFPQYAPFGLQPQQIHPLFTLIYIVTSIALLLDKPHRLLGIWEGTRMEAPCCENSGEQEIEEELMALR